MLTRFLFFTAICGAASAQVAEQPPAPVQSLWLGDVNGDGRDDAFIVEPDGSTRLLLNMTDGTFEDVTVRSGLGETRGAHMAVFGDQNGDGRTDLYLPSWNGPSHLMLQAEEGTFFDATEDAGLPLHAEPIDASLRDVDGDVFADGAYTGPADFAEMLRVSTGAESSEPGDVVSIDPDDFRSVKVSSQPYSRLVAGVYSTKPGFVGSEREFVGAIGPNGESIALKRSDMAELNDEVPIAVVGIVPCKISLENGPVRPGDLLVTSSTPGHAMVDNDPPVGTVVGKSLQAFDGSKGRTGVIKILVTLQ